MRNGQQHNHKRMRGRNRRGGGGHNPLTRVYESNGPDVKIRGTAHHIAEKYLQLARDAQSSGDPVSGENYLQHAEHYFRLIAAAQQQLQQQNPNMQQQPVQRSDQAPLEGDSEEGDDMGGDEQPYAAGAPMQQQNAPRPQPQNMPQPNYQPRDNEGGLPAFITGGAPQQAGFNGGHDNEQGDNRGGRFNRNRGRNRFRPRGPNEFENRGDQQNAQPAETSPAPAPAPAKSESAE